MQNSLTRDKEYTRALNATKLSRMFAAPFIADLGKGHGMIVLWSFGYVLTIHSRWCLFTCEGPSLIGTICIWRW